jgi:hypothetical protein
MTYVARERVEISIAGFQGTPTELFLEVIKPNETSTTFALGGTEIKGDAVTGYYYQFVPADNERDLWKWRWYGKDANGIEFARPGDIAYASLIVR